MAADGHGIPKNRKQASFPHLIPFKDIRPFQAAKTSVEFFHFFYTTIIKAHNKNNVTDFVMQKIAKISILNNLR